MTAKLCQNVAQAVLELAQERPSSSSWVPRCSRMHPRGLHFGVIFGSFCITGVHDLPRLFPASDFSLTAVRCRVLVENKKRFTTTWETEFGPTIRTETWLRRNVNSLSSCRGLPAEAESVRFPLWAGTTCLFAYFPGAVAKVK